MCLLFFFFCAFVVVDVAFVAHLCFFRNPGRWVQAGMIFFDFLHFGIFWIFRLPGRAGGGRRGDRLQCHISQQH